MTMGKLSLIAYESKLASRVAEFFERCHQGDKEVRRLSQEAWEGFVALGQNQGGIGFAVACADDKVVGLLMSHRATSAGERVRHFRIIVEPEHRRVSIGRTLLEHVAGMDDEHTLLQSNCPEAWTAARSFLHWAGMSRFREQLGMERSLENHELEPASSEVPISVLNEAADAAIAKLHNEAYATSTAFTPLDTAGVKAARLLPGSIFLGASSPSGVRGYVQTVVESAEEGCIESLVVAIEERRKGLGRALMSRGIHELAAQGCKRVVLSVEGANEPAMELYSDMGFKQTSRQLGFQGTNSSVLASINQRM